MSFVGNLLDRMFGSREPTRPAQRPHRREASYDLTRYAEYVGNPLPPWSLTAEEEAELMVVALATLPDKRAQGAVDSSG